MLVPARGHIADRRRQAQRHWDTPHPVARVCVNQRGNGDVEGGQLDGCRREETRVSARQRAGVRRRAGQRPARAPAHE